MLRHCEEFASKSKILKGYTTGHSHKTFNLIMKTL